jgi:hypothetical protein
MSVIAQVAAGDLAISLLYKKPERKKVFSKFSAKGDFILSNFLSPI